MQSLSSPDEAFGRTVVALLLLRIMLALLSAGLAAAVVMVSMFGVAERSCEVETTISPAAAVRAAAELGVCNC